MTKEEYIENIERKLCLGRPLEKEEITCVMSALYEANNCFQEPYYEVVYHDKFGNTEHRIMEPVSRKIVDAAPRGMNEEADKWMITEDHFELSFRRMEKRENASQN